MRTKAGRSRLLASTALLAAATAFAGVASAQTTPTAPPPAQGDAPTTTAPAGAQSPDTGSTVSEVVVTGSILRRKLSNTDAPITTVTSEDLNLRGITTAADAIQQISANGSSALPNSFTASGAFAAGASAASLRGLTSDSTLTLIDGLRTAYYPLADDGTRNFVDLNSIPDVVIDRIETLKDGASSTYGADAIAGVVNVITRKTYDGLMVKAEAGATQHGGGDSNNFQALIGHGDLNKDGYNVYLGLEYEHDDALYSRQRDYPYNTADQSGTCGVSLVDGSRTCRRNGVLNGVQFDDSFQGVSSTIVPVVRPFASAASGASPLGDYRLLNPAAGCGGLKAVTINPSQVAGIVASGGDPGITAPTTLCQQDLVGEYGGINGGEISPDDKRFSATFRATKALGDDAQAYFTASYYQNDVLSRSAPAASRETATPGPNGLAPYSTAGVPGLVLPVYVCPQGSATYTCDATSAGATLNPNNPFAAQGQVASLYYLFGDIPAYNEQFSQVYRIATGVSGSFNFLGDWHYSVDGTAAESDLRNTQAGNLFITGLLSAVNTGSYNFVDPSANTQAVRDQVAPISNQLSISRLFEIQANISRDLYQLPGGPLQLGLTASARYESINNPSANPDDNGPLDRYLAINPFGVVGHRDTEAVGFELDAPIVHQLDLSLSGRYDTYSTGQDNFSPKVGARIRPFADWAPAFDKVTLRTTYSQGFRIPSFAESNAFPTTGFVTATAPASFLAAHGNDGYGLGYGLGTTEISNPNLKPERSDNFTVGVVLEPIRQLSFSFDFYRIKKRDVITGDTTHLSEAIAAYYNGTPVPAGYTVTPGDPDPNHPELQPTLGFVSYSFANLNQETTSGYDIGATARFNLPFGIKYTSVFDANYVLRLNVTTADGVQHYAGTIGPFFNVAGAGTPKFKANWQNAISYGPATVAVTAYYTDGYALQAEDYGDTTGVCITDGASASSINATYLDGVTPVACKVKPFWDIDTHLSYDVTKSLQFYLDIQNLFDRNAPYDPTTYGALDYNAVIGNAGIYGRTFKVGLKATF